MRIASDKDTLRRLAFVLIVVLLCLAGCGRQDPVGLDKGLLVPINGTELFVRVVGEGDPVIVIHGGPVLEHGYLFKHLEPLSRSARLIFYDQRLSGRSSADVDTAEVTMANFVADIEAIRARFGGKRVHIMGHSWGGLLAMQYALAHGNRVQSLILLNSLPDSWAIWQEENRRLAMLANPSDQEARDQVMQSEAFARKDVAAYEELYRIGFRSQFHDVSLVDSLEFYIAPDLEERGQRFSAMMPDLMNYDIHEQLREVTAPTYIEYGAAEPAASLSGQRLRIEFPNARLVIIPNSGHFPFVESPDFFLQSVGAFLKANEL